MKEKKRFLILLLCSALLFSLCPQSVFAKADITTQDSGTDVAVGNPAEQEQMSDEGKDSVLERSDNSVHTAENSVSGNDAALHNAEKEVMPLAEDGDYIAEAVADGYTYYVYKMKTVDEIISNISSWTNYKTVVITMLKDVELTETLQFSRCYTNLVLDLNGKTLSGNLESPLVAVDYSFISGASILIKNGTIRNTGNGAAFRLVDGKTMLEDVDVSGDIIFTDSFITYKYHMPVFCGGGTFSGIKMDSGYPKHNIAFSDMLEGEGWYFADADSGERISRDCLTAAEPLENVTIKPCNHKNPDGSSAFQKVNTSSGLDCKCSICGNLCPHKQVEDNQCQECSLEIAAKWYYTMNSVENTEYFTSFYKAMEAASIGGSNHLITLLRNQESSACDYETDWHDTTVDFNGFTLKQNSMEIKRGTVIFQNTGSTAGHYQGTVSVGDDTFNGTLRVDAKNVIIDRLEVGSNGNAELRGGTFGTIVIDREDMALADLLAEDYYYADSTGNPIVTGNSDTELEDVTVVECKHDGSMAISIYNKLYDRNNWFCPCGKVTFTASVSKDGNTLYYEDMQNALDKAPDGSTVRFLSFIDIEDKFTIPNDVIIDLTGSDYFFYSGYDTRLTIKGTVTLVSAGNTSAGSIEDTEFDIAMDVQSGGKLIVPEQYENTKNRVNYTGYLTVGDGGMAQLDGGSYKSINPQNGGEVVISGGSCSYINVADGSKVTIAGGVYENLTILGSYEGVKLSGGSFKEIIIREYNWDNGTSRTVTYADFAALLDSGRAFQKEDNTYVGKDDVKEYINYTSVPAKFIENVTIIDSPIQNLTAYSRVSDKDYKEPVSVQYGMQSGKEFSLRSEIRFRTDANPSANYQWYQIDSEGSWIKIENAATEIYDIPSTMSPGTYTYVVEAENDGCICYSKPYTVTIIPRVLSSIMVDQNTLTRVYDGTKNTDFKVVGFYDSTGEEISFLNEDDFRLDQAMYNDSSVGEGGSPSDRCIEYEITLLNPNYAFDLQESMTLKGSYDAYITKAEAPVAASGMLTVANNQEAEYHFNFKTLLPEAPVGNYGTITYTLENGDIQLDDYYIGGAVLADGVLTLPIQKVDSTEENQIGTVTVTVKTQNYEDITLTLAVSAANENGGSTGGNENGGNENGGATGGSENGGNKGESDVEEDGDSEKESNVADGSKETAADEKKVLQVAEGARPGRENSTSVAPVSTMVSMLEGEEQKWEHGSEETIRFRSSAAFEEFLKVLIDEKEVDPDNYLVYEGSTIVELKSDYLELLSEGEHTISIVSKSGTVTATFVIAKGKEVDVSKDNESIPPQDAESSIAQEKEPDAVPISNGSSSQSTESRSYGVIGGVLLCIGGIVIAASVVYRKRKK